MRQLQTSLQDLNLNGDAVADFFYMADDTHMPSALAVKRTERIDGISERYSAESAEALVNEESIDCKALADVRQRKSKCQRNEETFTTAQ